MVAHGTIVKTFEYNVGDGLYKVTCTLMTDDATDAVDDGAGVPLYIRGLIGQLVKVTTLPGVGVSAGWDLYIVDSDGAALMTDEACSNSTTAPLAHTITTTNGVDYLDNGLGIRVANIGLAKTVTVNMIIKRLPRH